MPILLYCLGGLVVAIGAAMIGLGIPNNEFGIGNTLILAGTTAFASGLIIGAIGVAVAQLQRVVEALATRAPIRSSRPFDTFDPAAAARPQVTPARVPFPPKTKPEFRPAPPAEDGLRDGPRDVLAREAHIDTAQPAAAPTLHNPDEPPVTVADEAYLSPLHPAAPRYSREDDEDHDNLPPPPRKSNTYFDAMWPAEPKPPEQKPAEPKVSEFHWSNVRRSEPNSVDAKPEPKPAAEPPVFSDPGEPVAEKDLDDHADTDAVDASRNVAILKSGVVDGMGYTLYVDGSIEAELPQGTLRFASINELRSHLEKTS